MEKEITPTLISTLGGGLLSGVLILLLTHLLTRRKTDAEIREIDANTQKTMLEVSEMKTQSEDVGVRTRTIDRLKLAHNKTLILKEEERTIRG